MSHKTHIPTAVAESKDNIEYGCEVLKSAVEMWKGGDKLGDHKAIVHSSFSAQYDQVFNKMTLEGMAVVFTGVSQAFTADGDVDDDVIDLDEQVELINSTVEKLMADGQNPRVAAEWMKTVATGLVNTAEKLLKAIPPCPDCGN